MEKEKSEHALDLILVVFLAFILYVTNSTSFQVFIGVLGYCGLVVFTLLRSPNNGKG